MHISIGQEIRLYVDVQGAGLVPDGATMRAKPTLVMLHGGPGFDHSHLKPIDPRLADLAQVVFYDHRGNGRSDPRPPEEWTLDVWADDVVRLCEAMDITRPIVYGESFGGMVAQRYIARHPDHPGKVILASTMPRMALEHMLEMFEYLGGERARNLANRIYGLRDMSAWPEYEKVCFPLFNPNVEPDVAAEEMKRVLARSVIKQEIMDHFLNGEMKTLDLRPGLANTQCPVLVLVGELDPVCPMACSKEIAESLPAKYCHLVSIQGAGHGVWKDKPEEAYAAVRDFILQ